MLIIGGFMLLGFVGGAYYLGTLQKNNELLKKDNDIQRVDQLVIKSESKENQRMYSNENLKFSFEIPQGYKLENENTSKASFSGTYGDNQIIQSQLVVNFQRTIDLNSLIDCEDVQWQDDVINSCLDGGIENKNYNGINMTTFNLQTGSKNSQARIQYIIQPNIPKIEFIHQVIAGGVQSNMEFMLSTFKSWDQDNITLSEADIVLIKQLLAKHHNVAQEQVVMDLYNTSSFSKQYASGNYGIKNVSGGAKWFGQNIDGSWKIVYIGNGLPECKSIAQYNLPKKFLTCY